MTHVRSATRPERKTGPKEAEEKVDSLQSRAKRPLVTLLLRSGLLVLPIHPRHIPHKLHVPQLQSADSLQQMRVRIDRLRLVHADVVVASGRVELDADSVGREDGADGLEALGREADSVADGTAVGVGADVGVSVEELGGEVAVG